MRIGVEATPLKSTHQYRGVGFYTKNLIRALKKYKPENQYILFTRTETLPKNLDLVHYPCFDPFFLTLPTFKKTKTVVTIHDLTPLVFPDKFPRGIKGELKWRLQNVSLNNVEAVMTDSVNSKKDIIKFTNFPAKKIFVIPLAPGEEFKKLPVRRQGGAISDFRPRELRGRKVAITSRHCQLAITQKYHLPDIFVLYVGDVNWNKNLPGLIRAFSQLIRSTSDLPAVKAGVGKQSEPRDPASFTSEVKSLDTSEVSLAGEELASAKPALQKCDERRFSEAKLVLVGKAFLNEQLKETQEIKQLIDKLNIKNSVLRLGFVPTQDLVAVYNLATVYCQPSFYEGFGLPPLEAMACGTPVVVSDIPTLREACGEAAVYVNPKDSESIKEGIEKVFFFNDLKHLNISKKGLEQAKKFSWKKVAEQTIGVYGKILQKK